MAGTAERDIEIIGTHFISIKNHRMVAFETLQEQSTPYSSLSDLATVGGSPRLDPPGGLG
jgi:hypothetical protein